MVHIICVLKKKKIFNYVSKFTKWIKGNYIVKSNIDGKTLSNTY